MGGTWSAGPDRGVAIAAAAAVAAVAAVLCFAGGCTTSPPQADRSGGTVRTAAEPPVPTIAAALGKPKKVTDDHGRQALIQLNGVRYKPSDDETLQLALVDISILGSSETPFPYSEDAVGFAYADEGSPYTHHDDDHLYGPSPMEDYIAYVPPQPLRVGTVMKGHTKRGQVILRMSKGRTPYVLYFFNSGSAEVLAAWSLTPPG